MLWSFDRIHERDRRTDETDMPTPHDGIRMQYHQ